MTSASTLNVTSFPIPAIQGVTLSAQNAPGCSTIQATITGTNLASGDTVQLNGSSFRSNLVFVPSLNSFGLLVTLPAGAIPQSGPLTFRVMSNSVPAVVSDPFTLPSTGPAMVAVCSSPVPANVYANTSFSVFLTAAEVNSTAIPTVSLGALPTGITLTSPSSISIPPSGAALSFTAASNVVPGSYTVPFTGQAGSLSIAGSLQLNIVTGSPQNFYFLSLYQPNLGWPSGVPIK